MSKISIEMNVRCAAAVRQVLFESQREYSYEHVPERIVEIRSVIQEIDNTIGKVIETP